MVGPLSFNPQDGIVAISKPDIFFQELKWETQDGFILLLRTINEYGGLTSQEIIEYYRKGIYRFGLHNVDAPLRFILLDIVSDMVVKKPFINDLRPEDYIEFYALIGGTLGTNYECAEAINWEQSLFCYLILKAKDSHEKYFVFLYNVSPFFIKTHDKILEIKSFTYKLHEFIQCLGYRVIQNFIGKDSYGIELFDKFQADTHTFTITDPVLKIVSQIIKNKFFGFDNALLVTYHFYELNRYSLVYLSTSLQQSFLNIKEYPYPILFSYILFFLDKPPAMWCDFKEIVFKIFQCEFSYQKYTKMPHTKIAGETIRAAVINQFKDIILLWECVSIDIPKDKLDSNPFVKFAAFYISEKYHELSRLNNLRLLDMLAPIIRQSNLGEITKRMVLATVLDLFFKEAIKEKGDLSHFEESIPNLRIFNKSWDSTIHSFKVELANQSLELLGDPQAVFRFIDLLSE